MARPVPDFEGFVGQRRTISLVRRHLDGSIDAGTPFPNTLLSGPPGYGKSSLARAIASARGTAMTKVVAARDMKSAHMHALLEPLKHGDLLLIDEAHQLRPELQDYMLGATGEDRQVQVPAEHVARGAHRTDVAPVADFTLVVATDQPGQLRKALRSRIQLELPLEPYTDKELREIAARVCAREGVPVSTHAITLIAHASRGVPRRAGQLADLLRTYFPGLKSELSKGDVRSFLQCHGYDDHFMLPSERRYLKELRLFGRPARLHYMANVTGQDVGRIRNEIEPELMRRRLVEIVPGGRVLTSVGRALVEEELATLDNAGSEQE